MKRHQTQEAGPHHQSQGKENQKGKEDRHGSLLWEIRLQLHVKANEEE